MIAGLGPVRGQDAAAQMGEGVEGQVRGRRGGRNVFVCVALGKAKLLWREEAISPRWATKPIDRFTGSLTTFVDGYGSMAQEPDQRKNENENEAYRCRERGWLADQE